MLRLIQAKWVCNKPQRDPITFSIYTSNINLQDKLPSLKKIYLLTRQQLPKKLANNPHQIGTKSWQRWKSLIKSDKKVIRAWSHHSRKKLTPKPQRRCLCTIDIEAQLSRNQQGMQYHFSNWCKNQMLTKQTKGDIIKTLRLFMKNRRLLRINHSSNMTVNQPLNQESN